MNIYKHKQIVMSSLLLCLLILPVSCKTYQQKVQNNVYLENINVGGKSESEVKKIIEGLSSNINVDSKDAVLDEEKLEIIPETAGKRLDGKETMKAVLTAKEGDKVKLVIEEVRPKITSDEFKNKIVEIGSYSTPLLDSQKNRIENIKTASDCINNEKILPGQEFSFNNTLGRRTQEKGYKAAPIIKRTKDGPKKGYGVGGGICQISTTLYNAADKAGLEITERHVHSKNVGYVPKGKDATVAYDSVDFKFRNNLNNPVAIKVFLSKGKVTVKLYEIRI